MRLPRLLLNLALCGAVGAVAAAQAASLDPAGSVAAGKTRAQIRAETAAAVAAGQIAHGEATPAYPASIVSTKQRSLVRAETAAAVAGGLIAFGEATPDYPHAIVSTRSRADVRAETLDAMRRGLIPHGEAPAPVATTAALERVRLPGLPDHVARAAPSFVK